MVSKRAAIIIAAVAGVIVVGGGAYVVFDFATELGNALGESTGAIARQTIESAIETVTSMTQS